MKNFFGMTPNGESAFLYTITCDQMKAVLSDFGATLVQLMVPDAQGNLEDVVLGFDSPAAYAASDAYLGATVGRNANRIKGAAIVVNNKTYALGQNDGVNSLHSGPNGYERRLWQVLSHEEDRITFALHSPHLDQGFPGNADIQVTYRLTTDSLEISYEAVSDQDTAFNMTNHSYFNLAGHEKTEAAMEQVLMIPGRFFNPDDAENIPTGELRPVDGTPMDFRSPKPISRDIDMDYEPLHLQGGFDHNWEVYCNPCAILSDPVSGRTMEVHTDCPGIQFYAGNYLDEQGKDGVYYGKRTGVALETQFYPDCLHHPDWPQPIVKAGEHYHSETIYRFV